MGWRAILNEFNIAKETAMYKTLTRAALILGMAATIGIPAAFAQERFEWDGTRELRLKTVNGAIRLRRSNDL